MVVAWLELKEGKVVEKSISLFKMQDLLVFRESYFIYQYEYIVCIFTVAVNRWKTTLTYMWN